MTSYSTRLRDHAHDLDAAGHDTIGPARDFLTGNDVDYASSVGNWVPSAIGSDPTLTRDTGYVLGTTTASLKAVFSANANRYVEVPVSGSFLNRQTYWFSVLVSFEDADAVDRQITLSLGVPGGDNAEVDFFLAPDTGLPYVGTDAWMCVGLRWQPTSTHTSGVKARVTLVDAVATTMHLELSRVTGAGQYGGPPTTSDPTNDRQYLVPVNPSTATGTDNWPPLVMYPDADYVELSSWTNGARVRLADEEATLRSKDLTDVWGGTSHAGADQSGYGVNVAAGSDFVGFVYGEKSSTIGQFYGTSDYDFEFLDGASGRWRSLSGGVSRNFASMESRKGSGTATITSAATSVTVTHGAGYTPAAQDIIVVPTNSPTNDPGWWWVDTIGGTTFKINVRAVPGASTATFSWRVDR